MSDNKDERVEQSTSRYVTVFHQLRDSDAGVRGDRYISHGRHTDDRHVLDEEEEGFLPLARPIAVIDAGVEMTVDEMGEWCNSHAGKAVLQRYFPAVEADDPTLPDSDEYLDTRHD